MAGHRAGHLSRHVLNEMAGSAAGHDGVVGKSPPLSALVYPDSEGFWVYRAQGWCGGGREIKRIPRFQRNMGILYRPVEPLTHGIPDYVMARLVRATFRRTCFCRWPGHAGP